MKLIRDKNAVPSSTSRGFTLVEIIVALMIFSIVVVVALAALIHILDANRKAQSIQDAVVNLSFTMESMTREMRTGSAYNCVPLGAGADLDNFSIVGQSIDSACTTGFAGSSGQGVAMAFLTNKTTSCGGVNKRQVIAYELTPIAGSNPTAYEFKKASADCGTIYAADFSPVVSKQAMTLTGFYVKYYGSGYPLAYIKIDGNAGNKESEKTFFTLQTASSARIP